VWPFFIANRSAWGTGAADSLSRHYFYLTSFVRYLMMASEEFSDYPGEFRKGVRACPGRRKRGRRRCAAATLVARKWIIPRFG
jgi:hypothetical protein